MPVIAENLLLGMLKGQRSHVILVLSNCQIGQEANFLDWYCGSYHRSVLSTAGVISLKNYEQHQFDITQGRFPRLPFRYLGVCDIAVDGADSAGVVSDRITFLHQAQKWTQMPATWLYYPSSERVGRPAGDGSVFLTMAFANPVAGLEAEFKEWYATRHIRHALNLSALVSGQCFERSQVQKPGVMDARYSLVAMYDEVDPPEAMLEHASSLPEGTLDFAPSLDTSCFSESVYRRIA